MKRVLHAIVLTFFISGISFSQVVIKEKVNINPEIRVINNQPPEYTPCGPWITPPEINDFYQVVWNGSSFFLDPYQQLFNQQSNYYTCAFDQNTTYSIVVAQGKQYCFITKLGGLDTLTGEITESQMIGDTLLNVIGKDLIGTGNWLLSGCNTWEKENFPGYQFHIERDTPPGTEIIVKVFDGSNERNYHTIVELPAMELEGTPSAAALPHYYSSDFYLDAYTEPECYSGCGGYLPSWVKFSVEIVQGEEYGRIYDKYTEQSGSNFDNIVTENSWAGVSSIERFAFIADGVQPDRNQPGFVKILFTPSEAGLGTAEVNFNIEYNETPPIVEGLLVDTDKPEIQPGDTAKLILKYQNSDGTIIDLPGWRTYEVGLIEGCGGGQILIGDSLSEYFYDVPQPIKFVAADSMEHDSLLIKLQVGLIEVNIGVGKIIQIDTDKVSTVNESILKSKKRKIVYQAPESVKRERQKELMKKGYKSVENQMELNSCFGGVMKTEDIKKVKLIARKPYEILLGETKYFGVKKKVEEDIIKEIAIEEIKTEYGSNPEFPALEDGWDWIKEDVWGDNPVGIDTGKSYGKRMGVYWETEKPVWDDTIKKNNLTKGLIRLFGRYWLEDSTYLVTLKAKSNNGDSASIKLKVIKPKQLGIKHPKALDVFGDSLNVDSLCIFNGGKIGVPPQIIKGHMEKETNFKNSFRYEPSRDIAIQNNKNKKKKYLDDYPYYTVDSSSMGTVAMPSEHSNVKPVEYITNPVKIGKYLSDNIYNYVRKPKKDNNGNLSDPYFVGYEKGKPTIQLQNVYNKMKDSLDLSIAIKYAIDSLKKWLKTDNFKDGNKYAQSRIFSSYGMLQQVFYFACTDNIARYSVSNDKQTPESLNEIKYSIKAYKENIMKKIKNMSGNQCQDGFEGDWINILQSYNSNENGYGKITMHLSNKYLPK